MIFSALTGRTFTNGNGLFLPERRRFGLFRLAVEKIGSPWLGFTSLGHTPNATLENWRIVKNAIAEHFAGSSQKEDKSNSLTGGNG